MSRVTEWPPDRLEEAVAEAVDSRALPGRAPGAGEDQRIAWAAARLGWEALPEDVDYEAVERLLRGGERVLLRLGEGGGHLVLPAAAATLRAIADGLAPAAESVVESAGLRGKARDRARRRLVAAELKGKVLGRAWFLRPTGGGFLGEARAAGLGPPLAGFVAAHLVQYGLWLLSWGFAGRAALAGSGDGAWLGAWALCLALLVPFRLVATWLQGLVSIRAGEALRRRLIAGTLRLEPEEMRGEGAGRLLGRVLESEAVERLAVTGGLLGLVATLDLVAAALVLAAAGGAAHVALLGVWIIMIGVFARLYAGRRRAWAGRRLSLTGDLVENLVGHRTRVAQLPPELWHQGELDELDDYAGRGAVADRVLATMTTLIPRGWLAAGLLLAVPTLVAAPTARGAAVLGGVIIAFQALETLSDGLAQLAGAAVAAAEAAPLLAAANRRAPVGAPDPPPELPDAPILRLEGVSFTYPGRDRPALEVAGLEVEAGDRLLVRGRSGGGKSTLAAVIAGSREPQRGRVLLAGADRARLGAAQWARRVVVAPQFHENHVLLGPLAFNVLLGRRWPARPEDLADADAVLRGLGLGPVLDRMPAGLQQMLGESGWQLSQGEQSLLYAARAILQGADLVLLDESFGALDPVTHGRAVTSVLARPPALVVIEQ